MGSELAAMVAASAQAAWTAADVETVIKAVAWAIGAVLTAWASSYVLVIKARLGSEESKEEEDDA